VTGNRERMKQHKCCLRVMYVDLDELATGTRIYPGWFPEDGHQTTAVWWEKGPRGGWSMRVLGSKKYNYNANLPPYYWLIVEPVSPAEIDSLIERGEQV